MNKVPMYVLLLTNTTCTCTQFNTVYILILRNSSTVPTNSKALIKNNFKTEIFLLCQPHSIK